MMAFVPLTSTPASVFLQSMVMDLVMVTPPKPPGSIQLISPLTAVFEIAPANVLQGAVSYADSWRRHQRRKPTCVSLARKLARSARLTPVPTQRVKGKTVRLSIAPPKKISRQPLPAGEPVKHAWARIQIMDGCVTQSSRQITIC